MVNWQSKDHLPGQDGSTIIPKLGGRSTASRCAERLTDRLPCIVQAGITYLVGHPVGPRRAHWRADEKADAVFEVIVQWRAQRLFTGCEDSASITQRLGQPECSFACAVLNQHDAEGFWRLNEHRRVCASPQAKVPLEVTAASPTGHTPVEGPLDPLQ